MKDTVKKVWVCGCGEHNTENQCHKCGEPKGERKAFSLCPDCQHVHFSELHTCKK